MGDIYRTQTNKSCKTSKFVHHFDFLKGKCTFPKVMRVYQFLSGLHFWAAYCYKDKKSKTRQ